ncbi:MAG: gluconate 2-dehydrogenase subunit 3 family protein [Epsilonproteobacteria bacterium]|nr:MAG: gluconate 2-dehydrogenase subunit 3 family protein [Campylobacterota bacterium]
MIKKRRQFLVLSSILGLSPYVHAKSMTTYDKAFKKIEPTIAAVQEHMFPKGSKLPSAKMMNATQFLFETITHKSFDKDIRAFVLEGAEELVLREKDFTSMTSGDKEKALRAYEETNYGSSWLSRIMTLAMEGMFCDPVYGSNVNESGWKAINAYGGFPRPKTRYIEV